MIRMLIGVSLKKTSSVPCRRTVGLVCAEAVAGEAREP